MIIKLQKPGKSDSFDKKKTYLILLLQRQKPREGSGRIL